MTEIYFPFDNGAGADVTESEWRLMARLFRGSGVVTGVLNALEVYGDSSGMQVKLKTGEGWVDGFYYRNDAELILAVSAAHPTYGRLDRVVLRLDPTANTLTAAVLTGTPSAAPALPALTQSLTGTYEIALATITVDAAATYIAAGKVADTRTYSFAATGGALGNADYDSGWFAVAYSTTYTKAHGLGVTPRLLVVMHSAVAAPGSADELVNVTNVYHGGHTWNNMGADATNILVTTGNDASMGTCISTRRSSAAGYYRIQAWK